MIVDSHVHTHYCHGNSEVYRVVLEAIKKNIDNLGFSEHFHYDFFSDLGLPTIAGNKVTGTLLKDFKKYYDTVKVAKNDFKDKIKIRVGVEVDYLKIREEKTKEALKEFDFDFIMGAVHFIGEPLKYFSD